MDSPASTSTASALELRACAELVRTAYHGSIYGAPVAALVAVLFGVTMLRQFPARIVVPWMLFAIACNALRLVTRWRYRLRPIHNLASVDRWQRWFVAVSAITGLTWGVAMWLFYPMANSGLRTVIVLVLAGLTTGAARLLVPILWANLSYLYPSVVPLMLLAMIDADTRSPALGVMVVLYIGYMTAAARQQWQTLHRSIRLGFENAALVESLGAANADAAKLNRELSAEIARRGIVELELRTASERVLAASRAKTEFLATMSHEVRTPVNGLLGMLRIVRDSPLNAEQREHLDTAASSADTLLELINDILDFSKIEAGRLDLESIAFAPAEAVKNVADILRFRASA